jgi:hypothetical protein
MGVTDWVRRALAELGPDASVKQIGDYILARDSSVPRRYISLAVRKLKKKAGPSTVQRGSHEDDARLFTDGRAAPVAPVEDDGAKSEGLTARAAGRRVPAHSLPPSNPKN